MRTILRSLALAALAVGASPAMMAPAYAAEAAAKQPARYSVSTTLVGTLLDDPAANALLKKMIPTVYGNEMFQTMGRELTLQSIQQYEPEALSDENLKKLQAELDKLPAKG
jgi:para-nitrobenzyl esterase